MRRLLLVAILLAGAGCQRAPAPPPTAEVSEVDRLRTEAEALMGKPDYAGAVEKYKTALALSSESVPLRFGLGTAYSFLDKKPEAIEEFRWVIGHAGTDTREHQEARSWLLRVGALRPSAAETASATTSTTPTDSTPVNEVKTPEDKGRLFAKTEWPGITPRSRFIRGRVGIEGLEDANRDFKRNRPFRLGDVFEFRDLPPGTYRLMAKDEEKNIGLWDQQIQVPGGGKTTEITLTPSNSLTSPERYPGPESQ